MDFDNIGNQRPKSTIGTSDDLSVSTKRKQVDEMNERSLKKI